MFSTRTKVYCTKGSNPCIYATLSMQIYAPEAARRFGHDTFHISSPYTILAIGPLLDDGLNRGTERAASVFTFFYICVCVCVSVNWLQVTIFDSGT